MGFRARMVALNAFVFDDRGAISGEFAPMEAEPANRLGELREHQEKGKRPGSRFAFALQATGDANHVQWIREQEQE